MISWARWFICSARSNTRWRWGLQAFQSQHGGTEWHLLMAASVLVLPAGAGAVFPGAADVYSGNRDDGVGNNSAIHGPAFFLRGGREIGLYGYMA